MSETVDNVTPLPTVELSPPPRHSWGKPGYVASDTPSGCPQTERVCLHCRIVRVTVHSPDNRHWREWRHPASAVQFTCDHTPPCQHRVVA
jgi:hypothetical protein